MATAKKKRTDDAGEIPHRCLVAGKPERMAELENIRVDEAVARKIYDLRTKAGMSQKAFAKLVGTTATVICCLEDAEYEGHLLAMLNRIAAALDKRVEIRIVPMRRSPQLVSMGAKTRKRQARVKVLRKLASEGQRLGLGE